MPTASLTDLVLLWEDGYERGVDEPAERLCSDRPDLVGELRSRIAALKQMAFLNPQRVPTPGAAVSGSAASVRRAVPEPGEIEASPPECAGPCLRTPSPVSMPLLGRGEAGRTRLRQPYHSPPDLGRFPQLRLERVIGQGGFGQVWSGFHLRHCRPVAVKVFRQAPGDVRHWQISLRHEAERVARLHHPGIVPLLEMGEGEGWGYLAFPLIVGGNLRQVSSRGRPTVRQAARIVADVGMALDYAHHMGVVHRDVKPDNILLDRQGGTYLTDFGIAVRKGDLLLRGTEGAGTPAYMSPEQVLDCETNGSPDAGVATLGNGPRAGMTRRVDPRTDVWSLGVVLYELLTGRHPFAGQEAAGLSDAILACNPRPPRALDPAIPPALERACMKCLSRDPRGRFVCAMDLAAELRRHSPRLPDVSRPVRTAALVGATPLTGPAGRTLATVLDCVPACL